MIREELNVTPLGPSEHWPQNLRAACSLCFDTPLPACLVWGPARIQLPNPRYAAIHATADAARPGRDFAEAWSEAWPSIETPFNRALAGEGSRIDVRLGDEARTMLTLSLTPVRNESGVAEGVLIVAMQAADGNEVQQLREDLDTIDYAVAHDLHSPLRTMQEIARILSDEPSTNLPDDVRPFVHHLGQGITRLSAKADGIVRLMRVSRQALVRARVDVGEIVSALADEYSANAGDRSIGVAIHTLPAACGDAGLLRELFANVLSNAFKYTRHTAETRIEIGGAPAGAMIMYRVRDNGVGFDMKHASRLFKPFQRLHSEAQFEGLGIGLTIARQIVRRHGGAMHAEATTQGGALFQFTLPAAEDSPARNS
jgi:signal transduction histidine kinase